MTTNVLFWANGYDPKGIPDGCTFYRCLEPARVLGATGRFECRVKQQISVGDLYWANVIVGQRILSESATETWARIAAGHFGVRPKMVFEIDDDLFSLKAEQCACGDRGELGIHHPQCAYMIMRDPTYRENLLRNLERSDAITTTNAHLSKRMARFTAGESFVVPNWVSADYLREPLEAKDSCRIGWAGSPTHRADFAQVAPALESLIHDVDADVHLIGPNYLESDVHHRVTHTPWVPGVPAFLERLDFHIGLAPLTDSLFNRSKSDIKLKEYAARGMVGVATDVGPYLRSDVPHVPVTKKHSWDDSWRHAICLADTCYDTLSWKAFEWAKYNTLEIHIDDWVEALG